MNLVRDAMTSNVVTVPPYTALTSVAACMRDADVGCVLVVTDDTLHGLITDRDITVRVTAEGVIAGSATAHQAASGALVTVTSDTTLCEAAALMCDHALHRLPVVDDGHLVGLLSLSLDPPTWSEDDLLIVL
ncbi:CBS domain-containing protein [Streptomyces sp. LN500]|uniref:CBS domain-containing protein n=1 Tax=Streptomyces sp. LN500 TaxID=3112978 RepID=UPI0037135094